MKTLKKVLAKASKVRRHKRQALNIIVMILAWLVEFVGFTTVFIGTHILGHQNNIINLTLQTITNLIYFALVPSVLIVQSFDIRSQIVDNPRFDSFLAWMNMKYDEKDEDNDEKENEEINEGHNNTD